MKKTLTIIISTILMFSSCKEDDLIKRLDKLKHKSELLELFGTPKEISPNLDDPLHEIYFYDIYIQDDKQPVQNREFHPGTKWFDSINQNKYIVRIEFYINKEGYIYKYKYKAEKI